MHRVNIQKTLTFREKQAYFGAYDFYRFVIPIVMGSTLAVHAVLMFYEYQSGKTKQLQQNLPELLVLGIIAITTYIFASRFYKQCNKIDTTPIISLNNPANQDQTSNEIELEDTILGSKKPQKYYCPTCKITCDYRTRHCRKCQVCIQRYDHHCFWIGNCVGRHNHRQFYYFLLLQTLNNISLFLIIYLLPDITGWKYWIKLFGQLLSLGFCCFTGYLLIYHTMLVSCGITTWQHMRRAKITYLKYLPPGYNPFSLGFIQNWKQFLSQQTRACGSQTSQEWQKWVVNFDDAKSIKPAFNIIQNQYYSCC